MIITDTKMLDSRCRASLGSPGKLVFSSLIGMGDRQMMNASDEQLSSSSNIASMFFAGAVIGQGSSCFFTCAVMHTNLASCNSAAHTVTSATRKKRKREVSVVRRFGRQSGHRDQGRPFSLRALREGCMCCQIKRQHWPG